VSLAVKDMKTGNAFWKVHLKRPTIWVNIQRGYPFSNNYNKSWKEALNLNWNNNFSLNPIQGLRQNQPQRKPSRLVEMLIKFMEETKEYLKDMRLNQETT